MPVLAFAQTPPNPPPALLSSYDLIAPNGVAHVEELDVGGHRQLHCVVTSNEGSGELTFDGRTIQFGDGYAIELTTLARTPSSFVVRLSAAGQHGPSATAIIARSLRTGETTSAGIEGFSNAMRRSRTRRSSDGCSWRCSKRRRQRQGSCRRMGWVCGRRLRSRRWTVSPTFGP